MVVCRKSSSGAGPSGAEVAERDRAGASRVGEGGPVFLPRRKPSAITEAIMADTGAGDRAAALDEIWPTARPVV